MIASYPEFKRLLYFHLKFQSECIYDLLFLYNNILSLYVNYHENANSRFCKVTIDMTPTPV